LLVTAYVVPCSLILFALMMEATHSTETAVLTRVTQRHISGDGIFQSFRTIYFFLDVLLMFVNHGRKINESFVNIFA
jgi:hypothetical protein